MRLFLDVQFLDPSYYQSPAFDGNLMSLGIVGEDNAEFDAELSDIYKTKCDDCARESVLPQMGMYPDRVMGLYQLRHDLLCRINGISVDTFPVGK